MTAGPDRESGPTDPAARPPDSDPPSDADRTTRRETLAAGWPASSPAPRPFYLRAAREDDIFVAAASDPVGMTHVLLVLEAGSRLLAGRLAATEPSIEDSAVPPEVRSALRTVSRWILDLALPGST